MHLGPAARCDKKLWLLLERPGSGEQNKGGKLNTKGLFLFS